MHILFSLYYLCTFWFYVLINANFTFTFTLMHISILHYNKCPFHFHFLFMHISILLSTQWTFHFHFCIDAYLNFTFFHFIAFSMFAKVYLTLQVLALQSSPGELVFQVRSSKSCPPPFLMIFFFIDAHQRWWLKLPFWGNLKCGWNEKMTKRLKMKAGKSNLKLSLSKFKPTSFILIALFAHILPIQ